MFYIYEVIFFENISQKLGSFKLREDAEKFMESYVEKYNKTHYDKFSLYIDGTENTPYKIYKKGYNYLSVKRTTVYETFQEILALPKENN